MYQNSSHMYGTQWEPNIGIISNLVKVVESEQMMSFDPFRSPYNIIVSQIQTQPGFCASAAKIEPHHQHHQNNNIEVFPANWSFDEFPKTTTTTESTSVMFPSVAESLLSSSAESHSSSEKYSEFPSSYSSDKHSDIHHDPGIMAFFEQFPQEHDKLLRDDAEATDQKPLEISFQRNQMVSFTKAEKQCPPPCGVTTSSSNSASRRAASAGKRRIRWTKDLHESFMIIVNRLGGPDKAKPKAILEMMKSDLLSISHVKSHLQKCRTTVFQHKALHERSDEEGHKTDEVNELQIKIRMQIEESRQLQLEVKRSIHKQLEMQRSLQVLIEQQRVNLKMLYDQQKERTKMENI